ncbi:MAG: heavy-metal-associated domain-containing protein [Tannerella sp.]|nr:heavy-metal-associated domain-containing protein [Tannerella sp.]
MKKILLFMLCVVFASSTVFAQDTKKNDKEIVTFIVKNMECDNCVKKVEKNIAFEKGVTDLQCELSTQTVKVTYRKDKTSEKNLITAFKKLGYEAEKKAVDAKP